MFLFFGNLVLFICAHFSFIDDTSVITYIHLYLFKIWNMVFPTLVAILTVAKARARGKASLFTLPLLLSLTKAIYYLPYYYELYVLEAYYVSTDAVLDASILTASVILISYVHILVYSLLTMLALKLIARGDDDRGDRELSPYDLSNPGVLTAIVPIVLSLIYTFISELIDTVSFLKVNISTLNSNEIITMITNYLLMIVVHLLIYYVVIKKSLCIYAKESIDDASDN